MFCLEPKALFALLSPLVYFIRHSKRKRLLVKRGYSRAFTPQSAKRNQINIDRVPSALMAKIQAKTKREGISLRNLVLKWLSAWVQ